jgi:hypothetical protein
LVDVDTSAPGHARTEGITPAARLARAWRSEHEHGVLAAGEHPLAAREAEERAAAVRGAQLAHRHLDIAVR